MCTNDNGRYSKPSDCATLIFQMPAQCFTDMHIIMFLYIPYKSMCVSLPLSLVSTHWTVDLPKLPMIYIFIRSSQRLRKCSAFPECEASTKVMMCYPGCGSTKLMYSTAWNSTIRACTLFIAPDLETDCVYWLAQLFGVHNVSTSVDITESVCKGCQQCCFTSWVFSTRFLLGITKASSLLPEFTNEANRQAMTRSN